MSSVDLYVEVETVNEHGDVVTALVPKPVEALIAEAAAARIAATSARRSIQPILDRESEAFWAAWKLFCHEHPECHLGEPHFHTLLRDAVNRQRREEPA